MQLALLGCLPLSPIAPRAQHALGIARCPRCPRRSAGPCCELKHVMKFQRSEGGARTHRAPRRTRGLNQLCWGCVTCPGQFTLEAAWLHLYKFHPHTENARTSGSFYVPTANVHGDRVPLSISHQSGGDAPDGCVLPPKAQRREPGDTCGASASDPVSPRSPQVQTCVKATCSSRGWFPPWRAALCLWDTGQCPWLLPTGGK